MKQLLCGAIFATGLMCLLCVIGIVASAAEVRCGGTIYHNYSLYFKAKGDCGVGQGVTITRLTKRIWGAVGKPITKSYNLNIHIPHGKKENFSFKIVVPPDAPDGSKIYSSLTIDSYIPDDDVCNLKFNRYASAETTVVCDGTNKIKQNTNKIPPSSNEF